MRMKVLAVAISLMTSPALASDVLTGEPEVVDGRTMIVAGQQVELAGIAVPKPGTKCTLRGRLRDCGVMSRAGLMDITAGDVVSCAPVQGGYKCHAGTYDLGFGQIHAGWAVAGSSAPAHYLSRMNNAREYERDLWRATLPGSPESLALSLTH